MLMINPFILLVMTISFWSCAAITAISAFTSLGFSVAAARTSEGLARTNALYATARSAPLALASLVTFFSKSNVWLIAIASLMIVVQAIDAVIGINIGDKMKTYGPAITAAANFLALAWLMSQSWPASPAAEAA